MYHLLPTRVDILNAKLLTRVLALLIASSLCILFWGQTYDDVYLAFQYARNIYLGKGFVFNPSDPVLGSPAPGFILLLVILKTILKGVDFPQIGTIISSISFAGLFFVLTENLKKTLPLWLAICASIAAVFNPFTIAVFGGEAPLYLLLAVLTCAACCNKKYDLSGVLVGFALMCRTEAVVLLSVILIYSWLVNKKIPYLTVIWAILITAPWLVYATVVFGSPLSLSFTAKLAQVSAGRYPFPFGFASYLLNVSSQFPVLILFAPFALIAIRNYKNIPTETFIIVAWAITQTSAYMVLQIPFYHWYAPQLGILMAWLIAFGINSTFVKSRNIKNLFVIASVIGTCISILNSYNFHNQISNNSSNKLYKEVGVWLSQNSDPNHKVAFFEIGQIAYYSNREVIDTLGLVTSKVANHVAVNDWLWAYSHYQPDFIITDRVYKSIFEQYHQQLEDAAWFKSDFIEVARFEDVRSNTPLVIYKKSANS